MKTFSEWVADNYDGVPPLCDWADVNDKYFAYVFGWKMRESFALTADIHL